MSALPTQSESSHLPAGHSEGYVLVVDDHHDAADGLARLLGVLGRRAQVAYDAAGALAAIERDQPRLILLDLGMPQVDGFETARRIAARPEWQAIPLVALSGHSPEQYRDRTQASGFAAHLVKPVDLALLERTLDEFLPH